MENLLVSTKWFREDGCRLEALGMADLWAWKGVGERERAEWIRGSEKSSRREHINKLHLIHFSPHPAGIWRAPQKLLPETHVSWLQTHTDTHKQTNTLSLCLSLHSLLLTLWPHFLFLMAQLSAVVITKLLCYTVLHSQCKCLCVYPSLRCPLSQQFTIFLKLPEPVVCNSFSWVSQQQLLTTKKTKLTEEKCLKI